VSWIKALSIHLQELISFKNVIFSQSAGMVIHRYSSGQAKTISSAKANTT
jgi:hypothetical protein